MPQTITFFNSSSTLLTVTYQGSSQSLDAKTGTYGFTYTNGNFTIFDGKNTYTLLETGLTSTQRSYVDVRIVDTITVVSPVYDSSTPVGQVKNFKHTPNLFVALPTKTVITNFTDEFIVDNYSTYFTDDTSPVTTAVTTAINHYWWILILFLLVVVVALVGGVYYYKKKKRGGM